MIRVRFAPSPTGHLHIGGLRGALFNHIFARQHKGKFLLRIEDTDIERSRNEYTVGIVDAFNWCNISSDEELIFQSKRNNIYKQYIDALLSSGNAYYSDEPNEEGIISRIIKCKVNRSVETIQFNDIIRGNIEFATKEFDDFIIARSDGSPLYNFVVVVDDIEMGITHVIRGEEHLTNTPRQISIYKALGKNPPIFAHLPLILGQDGKKLSKRDAATAVIDYKKMGFLPQALCMYLIRLGWAHGDQEIFTDDELLKYFDLSKVHSAGAMFDFKKLCWINNFYLKKISATEIMSYAESTQEENLNFSRLFPHLYKDQIIALINLYKDRCNTLVELIENMLKIKQNRSSFESFANPEYQLLANKMHPIIEEFLEKLQILKENVTSQEIKECFDSFSKEKNIPLNMLFKISRIAIIDDVNSPSICSLIEIITIKEFIKNLQLIYKS
jgi:glutamyl-tRNA synthetase